MTDPIRVLHDARDFLDAGVEIRDVQFYKLEAGLNEDFEADDAALDAAVEYSPNFTLMVRHEDGELGVRLALELEIPMAHFTVDAAVTYLLDESLESEEDARLDFANKVGIMALMPYVRQALADLSQRLGSTIVLPIVKLGDFNFSADQRSD